MLVSNILQNTDDNMEINIYNKSTKYITLYDFGTKEYILHEYGNCVCTNYDRYENGIDLFMYID